MKQRRPCLPNLKIGDRVGALELVGTHERDANSNVTWAMKCIECGMVCLRSQSTVNRWRRGDASLPSTCKLAHDEKGRHARGYQATGVKGPLSATEKRRREAAAEERETRPQRLCKQCCGLTHQRPRKGPCKCGGRYAEERRVANDVGLMPSSAAMCLRVG